MRRPATTMLRPPSSSSSFHHLMLGLAPSSSPIFELPSPYWNQHSIAELQKHTQLLSLYNLRSYTMNMGIKVVFNIEFDLNCCPEIMELGLWFDGQISAKNIEIGIIGADKKVQINATIKTGAHGVMIGRAAYHNLDEYAAW
ncbi:hypothetical protein P8452_58618 [Trifolium repens]|nr:hypothetical protein P8452_58618 [Trifolium repens]